MHGIILAGGFGTRLWPLTQTISKQLLPVYDKPMIYYPLSLLMAAEIRDFSVIVTPRDYHSFQSLLGDGSQWGVEISVVIQQTPRGLPEAFSLVAESQLKNGSLLILGDNIFYGSQMAKRVLELAYLPGAAIFGYLVNEVSPFGSFELDSVGQVSKLAEKSRSGKGFAIPGLYKFDSRVLQFVQNLNPSTRGELEIVDLLNMYLEHQQLNCRILDRGTAWLDTGTVDTLNQASELIRVIQARQGMLIGSPEEVALHKGWVTKSALSNLLSHYGESNYAKSLASLL